MNKTVVIGVVAVIVIVGGLMFFGGGSSQNSATEQNSQASTVETFDKVPDFTLKDWDGNIVSLSDFAGKPIIINSWAVWCPFCLEELKDFAILQKELGDSVIVIAIDRSDSVAKQKKFVDKLNLDGDILFLDDKKDSFYKSIGGFSMPETIFVDKDGNIIKHKRGPMKLDEIRKKTQLIL